MQAFTSVGSSSFAGQRIVVKNVARQQAASRPQLVIECRTVEAGKGPSGRTCKSYSLKILQSQCNWAATTHIVNIKLTSQIFVIDSLQALVCLAPRPE